jgi:hypothetical protein
MHWSFLSEKISTLIYVSIIADLAYEGFRVSRKFDAEYDGEFWNLKVNI